MKLAIIGSRGFLVDYGGFETFVRKLVLELKDNGYDITVYGLKKYHNYAQDKNYPEIKRVWIPSVEIRFLEKVIASFFSILHITLSQNEIILMLGVSPGLLLWIPFFMGKKILMNVDGIEWKRPKWSKFIGFFLRLSEIFSSIFSHILIADSKAIQEYLGQRYKTNSFYIPYGADMNNGINDNDLDILKKYNLKQRDYFLQVCRLEPENNVHITIREFLNYKGTKQLIIVGDTPHSIKYREHLKKRANGKVKLLGGIYGDDFKTILKNAYCYIHGHEAGGTNPALLEAMASNNCVLVLNVPYNLEVIGDCGISFSKESGNLLEKIKMLDKDVNLVNALKKKAFVRVTKLYTWKRVISEYDQIFKLLLRPGSKGMFHHGRRGIGSTKM
jgi:glycosyltransferase involved in cell wall biosynthesis